MKGLVGFTRKGRLQSRIDHKNEEIDILKTGLSCIIKWQGVHTVHDFYKAYHSAKDAYACYHGKADKWEENYGEYTKKLKKESVYRQLQNYQRKTTESKLNRNTQKDYG